jgi:Tfp pilus assembly protein PilN
VKPQINLYNPQLRSEKELFTFRTLMIGIAGAFALATLGYAWYGYQTVSLGRQSRELDARLQTLRNETVSLSKEIAERGRDAQQEKRLQLLEAQHALLEDMRAALEQSPGASGAGFSEYMRAFARQAMPGVWLTGFSVAAEGAEMRIEGRAQNPDLVPAYIARLNSESLLQGRRFAQFAVRQSPVEATPPTAAAAPPQGRQPAPAYHEFGLVSSAGDGNQAKGGAQ